MSLNLKFGTKKIERNVTQKSESYLQVNLKSGSCKFSNAAYEMLDLENQQIAECEGGDKMFLYCPGVNGYRVSNSITKSFTSKTLATKLAKFFTAKEDSFRLSIATGVIDEDSKIMVYELALVPSTTKKDIKVEELKEAA